MRFHIRIQVSNTVDAQNLILMHKISTFLQMVSWLSGKEYLLFESIRVIHRTSKTYIFLALGGNYLFSTLECKLNPHLVMPQKILIHLTFIEKVSLIGRYV